MLQIADQVTRCGMILLVQQISSTKDPGSHTIIQYFEMRSSGIEGKLI